MFVTGVLEENFISGEYNGGVFDRTLVVRHQNGVRVEIFDGQVISADVPVGQIYEFILVCMVPWPLTYQPAGEASLPSGSQAWQGEITQLSWRAPRNVYTRVYQDLHTDYLGNDSTWVIVQTLQGAILMSEREIRQEASVEKVSVGAVLTWASSRFHLYAIV